MNKYICLVGLPASGKSYYAKELAIKENAIIYSSDELRKELFGDVNEQNKNNKLFQEIHKRIKNNLMQGKNIIYDATNISYKKRKAFLEELKNINCEKICCLIATPYEKCLEQNKLRDRQVPENVIRKMYKNFFIPQWYEGWDKIEIIYNTNGYNFDLNELFNGENGLNKIDQENPYHTLTIGEHCLKCSQECEKVSNDFQLNMAALFHDIGKRFTKEFNQEKGYYTYYQHHLVSAYDSLFYLKDCENKDILTITNYIQWHMQPFFIKTEKSKNKIISLIGQKDYDKLCILHEADIKAK